MKDRTYPLIVIFIMLLGLISVLPSSGQYREYYIFGKVLDTQQNPLEGVEITLRDVNTSRSYSMKTKKDGGFRFAGLPHGVYNVVFKKEGYALKEDEWRFETTQERMQKVEIPAVVLVSQAQVQEAQRLKEAEAGVKESAEKIRQGDFDGAIALLKKVLEKNPKDSNALFLIGLSYVKKSIYQEAITYLTEVTQLSPNFPGAYFELGVCYQQQSDLARALEYYQKALDLDPNMVDSAYNSGLILFGMSRIDEALARFEKALSLRPNEPEFLEMAGRCYINEGNLNKAIEYLERAKAGYKDEEKTKFLDDLIAKLRQQIKK